MKVAIIADLHDKVDMWKKINSVLAEQKVEHLVVAGDISSIKTLDHIVDDYSGYIHVIFGNMDQNLEAMKITAEKYANLTVYGFRADFSINKKRFFISHYEQEVIDQADKQDYDVLCCAHTHEKKQTRTKDYLLINPGTAGGIFAKPSFAIYDLDNDQLTFFDL